MPRASSRSADPVADDAARLPCLTTGSPVAATTIEAIVEMLTVLDRSPPVPTTSTTRRRRPASGTAWRTRTSCRRALRPRPPSHPWHAAPPRRRRSARGRLAGQDLGHRPRRLRGRQVVPGHQRPEHLGPGQCRPSRQVSAAARGQPLAHEPGGGVGQHHRVERVRHHGVGPRPGGQPAVLRTSDQHQHRRGVEDLVLELRQTPMPPTGVASPSRMATSTVRRPAPEHVRLGGDLDDLDLGRSGSGRVPSASRTWSRVAGRRCRPGSAGAARRRRRWRCRRCRGAHLLPAPSTRGRARVVRRRDGSQPLVDAERRVSRHKKGRNGVGVVPGDPT
jgi:hypothetical protein